MPIDYQGGASAQAMTEEQLERRKIENKKNQIDTLLKVGPENAFNLPGLAREKFSEWRYKRSLMGTPEEERARLEAQGPPESYRPQPANPEVVKAASDEFNKQKQEWPGMMDKMQGMGYDDWNKLSAEEKNRYRDLYSQQDEANTTDWTPDHQNYADLNAEDQIQFVNSVQPDKDSSEYYHNRMINDLWDRYKAGDESAADWPIQDMIQGASDYYGTSDNYDQGSADLGENDYRDYMYWAMEKNYQGMKPEDQALFNHWKAASGGDNDWGYEEWFNDHEGEVASMLNKYGIEYPHGGY